MASKLSRAVKIIRGGMTIWGEVKKAQRFGYDFTARGDRINQVLYELGPTFIKLGQMLSVRTDIIPQTLADELRKLLDRGPAVDFRVAEELFQKEFGHGPRQLFETFEAKPFAVASISQVYKATYKSREVAVKIQKPGIHSTIKQDLAVLSMLLPLVKLVPSLGRARRMIESTIQEFFAWIEHELDYRLEALNMSRIADQLSGLSYCEIPPVIHEYSTKRVLCMEFVQGVSLNEIFGAIPNLPSQNLISYKHIRFRRKVLIEHIRDIVFKQIVEDGYFHADPHPGNIFVLPGGKVALIDFGVVGTITPPLRKQLVSIFSGLIENNVERIAKTMQEMDQIDGQASLEQVEEQVRVFLNSWQSGSILEKTTAQAFFDLIQIALRAGIDPPLPVIILGKTILEYDGVLRHLDPEYDILRAFEPLIKKQMGLKGFAADLIPDSVKDLAGSLDSFPNHLQDIIKKLAGDGVEFTVRFGPHKK